jgi:large subunit ribosomal protein L7/L12
MTDMSRFELPEVALAVRVESAGPRKINVIKVVREALGLGLRDAKERVDQAPFEVPMGEDRSAAEALADRLREAGADAVVVGGRDEGTEPTSGLSGAVVLERVGPRKINVIMVVREVLGLGLAETKALVERAPVVLRERCGAEEARDLARRLEAAGARVSLDAHVSDGPPRPLSY